MKLTPDQIQLLRDGIVAICAAAGSTGMPIRGVLGNLRAYGFANLTEADADAHLHFLVSDGKLTVGAQAMSAAVKRWTITADGTRYAEANGLL